jgi:hypothetical protein
MNDLVILPGYLQGDVSLKFPQCQSRMPFGIVFPAFLDVAGCRAWQEMDRSHLRANQAFDVPPEMRLATWSPIDLDAFIPASPLECPASKVRTVVDMDGFR